MFVRSAKPPGTRCNRASSNPPCPILSDLPARSRVRLPVVGAQPACNHLCQIIRGQQTSLTLCDACLRLRTDFELTVLDAQRCFYWSGVGAASRLRRDKTCLGKSAAGSSATTTRAFVVANSAINLPWTHSPTCRIPCQPRSRFAVSSRSQAARTTGSAGRCTGSNRIRMRSRTRSPAQCWSGLTE